MYTTTPPADRGYTREELDRLRDELGRDELFGQVAHWSDDALADRLKRREAARARREREIALHGGEFAALRAHSRPGTQDLCTETAR